MLLGRWKLGWSHAWIGVHWGKLWRGTGGQLLLEQLGRKGHGQLGRHSCCRGTHQAGVHGLVLHGDVLRDHPWGHTKPGRAH